nr:MAG TPA: RNA polymerase sigma factor [Caudoviricetes sp.]
MKHSASTCPLWLFRSGKDTYEIAAILHVSEQEVERRIHIIRSNETRMKARFERSGEQAA